MGVDQGGLGCGFANLILKEVVVLLQIREKELYLGGGAAEYQTYTTSLELLT